MTLTIKGATTIKSLTTVGFYPGSLFAAGEQGVWYDPSDMTTMFQDAAGTTPVTAVEQPVGLLLDKRNINFSTSFASNAYQSVAANSAFTFGNGSFTIEGWVYVTAWGTIFTSICSNTLPGGANNAFNFGITSTRKVQISTWNIVLAVSTNTISLNTWTHVAASFDGTTYRVFINGALEGTGTTVYNLSAVNAFNIGYSGDAGNPFRFTGYIAGLRVVKGSALYTASFTLPTSLPAPVTGTSILTGGTSWSGNPTITNNGTISSAFVSPFGSGNHATQSTAGSRPTLSARVNLLTKTEDLTNATVWSYLSGASVVSAKVFSFTANDSRIYAATTSVTNNGVGYTLSASFSPADAGKKIRLAYFVSGSWTPGSDITIPANGYVSVTFTGQVTYIGLYAPSVDFTQTYTLLTGVDLRPTNQGVNLPTYQRVNTSSDYDTTNFPMYLKFDGTNMSLASTADISTNRFYIATGVLFEDITNNRFAISKGGSGNYYPAYGINAFSGNVTVSMYNGVPNTINASGSINRAYVVDGNYETSAYTATLNANQIGSIATSAAPTYNTDPFVLGIMAASGLGATYRLKGNLYGAMMVGRSLSNAEKLSMENWLNQKTKAY